MKIFIAYRFSGEDFEQLTKTMKIIIDSLARPGTEVICTLEREDFFRSNKYTHKQILEDALKELEQADKVLAFVNSDNRSEGMLIEVGYAMAKNIPVILAKRSGAKVHSLEAIAQEVIQFEDIEDLSRQLRSYDFNK